MNPLDKVYNDNIQFKYLLQDAHFFCHTCNKKIILKADKRGKLKKDEKGTYTCKCGTTFKLPHYYVDTYHNKKVKEITKWV